MATALDKLLGNLPELSLPKFGPASKKRQRPGPVLKPRKFRTRGLKNFNPGNIRVGVLFDGIATPAQRTPVQQIEKEFTVFTSMEMGLRALARNSLVSNKKRSTIRNMIEVYAPPSENNTEGYIAAVAKSTGFDPEKPVDLSQPDNMLKFMKAIINQENGIQPFTDDELRTSMALAGVA